MDSDDIAFRIHDILISSGRTVSTAESCTSGQIAALLTSVSGSSSYFQGGIVAYQNGIKTRFLGVSADDIVRYDVVSRQVAVQMVSGACSLFGTDYAIASTGYAEGGNGEIPSGTIWIACGTATDIRALCLTEDTGRNENTRRAASAALRMFLEYLEKD